jgi:tetratricopeptide (TPR) repeat protein
MDSPGPRDISRLLKAIRVAGDAVPAEYALDALRLSNYDPRVFANFYPAILRLLPEISPRQQRALNEALDRVRAHLYPVGIQRDVPYRLAAIYGALGRVVEGAELFRQSLRERGEGARALFGLAMCEEEQGHRPLAAASAERSLQLDPDNPHVIDFLEELRAGEAAISSPV